MRNVLQHMQKQFSDFFLNQHKIVILIFWDLKSEIHYLENLPLPPIGYVTVQRLLVDWFRQPIGDDDLWRKQPASIAGGQRKFPSMYLGPRRFYEFILLRSWWQSFFSYVSKDSKETVRKILRKLTFRRKIGILFVEVFFFLECIALGGAIASSLAPPRKIWHDVPGLAVKLMGADLPRLCRQKL